MARKRKQRDLTAEERVEYLQHHIDRELLFALQSINSLHFKEDQDFLQVKLKNLQTAQNLLNTNVNQRKRKNPLLWIKRLLPWVVSVFSGSGN